MKNIFIEGLQGAGKSTLLNEMLNIFPALQVCREGDYSPVELAWCTWMTEAEYEQILTRYHPLQEEIRKNTVREGDHFIVTYTRILTDIPNFHRELEKYEIYNGRKSLQEFKKIVFSRYENYREKVFSEERNCKGMGYVFECAFFQNITEELILFQLLSDEEIVDFYRELFARIEQENFRLLYLYSENVAENIAVIRKERSDSHGNEMWYPLMLEYLVHSPYGKKYGCSSFEDLISHLEHRQQLELRIIREVIGERAVILPAKKWKREEIEALQS